MPGPQPLVVDLAGGVGAAFLPRSGGCSPSPYDSLNLALHVGDDAPAVLANRSAVARTLGIDAGRTTWAEQVHGAGVAVVSEAEAGRGSLSADDACSGVDALVTTARSLPLATLVADCLPVLLAAADGVAVAAVHAGRRGLLAGVVGAAVGELRAAGGAARVRAVVGPHIGACCYEVGDDVYGAATASMPALAATTSDGRRSLDLTAAVRSTLADLDVDLVDVVGGCTACDPDRWFSYRRDGVTGRLAGLVWRR